jgi:hypothetical protein
MTLLSSPLALHAFECPEARCSCGPVRDVEALVRSAVRAHHRGGLGPEGGRETEDLLAELFFQAARAASRPRSAGWVSRPFVDFVVALVHDRITDWYRARYPGSRYGRALELVGYEVAPEERWSGDVSDSVDVGRLSVSGRWTYFSIAVPMAREGLDVRDVAALRRPAGEEHPRLRFARGGRARIVERLLGELRAELELQGVRPTVRAEPSEVGEAMSA